MATHAISIEEEMLLDSTEESSPSEDSYCGTFNIININKDEETESTNTTTNEKEEFIKQLHLTVKHLLQHVKTEDREQCMKFIHSIYNQNYNLLSNEIIEDFPSVASTKSKSAVININLKLKQLVQLIADNVIKEITTFNESTLGMKNENPNFEMICSKIDYIIKKEKGHSNYSAEHSVDMANDNVAIVMDNDDQESGGVSQNELHGHSNYSAEHSVDMANDNVAIVMDNDDQESDGVAQNELHDGTNVQRSKTTFRRFFSKLRRAWTWVSTRGQSLLSLISNSRSPLIGSLNQNRTANCLVNIPVTNNYYTNYNYYTN